MFEANFFRYYFVMLEREIRREKLKEEIPNSRLKTVDFFILNVTLRDGNGNFSLGGIFPQEYHSMCPNNERQAVRMKKRMKKRSRS